MQCAEQFVAQLEPVARISDADDTLPQRTLPLISAMALPAVNPIGSKNQVLLKQSAHLARQLPMTQRTGIGEVVRQRAVLLDESGIAQHRQHAPGQNLG